MDEPVMPRAARLRRPALIAIGLAAALLPLRADGQVAATRTFHPVDSYTAETLLRRASEQAAQSQWAEALDLYQKVIAQYGEAMAQVPKGDPMADPSGATGLFVDARQHAQARIAALPPLGRALYRQRVDAQAERLYRQGLADRDREPLRKIVDDLFVSSRGDDALELLGDLAFSDGRFGEALGYYRRLIPAPNAKAAGLAYPDPDVDPARVSGKILLARAALGEDPPSADEVRAYAAAYPAAKGSLAGREGPLGQSVASALAQDHLAPPAQNDGRWPTFAGAPSRSRIAPGPIDIGQFQWREPLRSPPTARPNVNAMAMPMRGPGFGGMPMPQPMAPGIAPDVELPYYPIVLGDQVVLCDEGRIRAFHLNVRPEDGDDPAGGDGRGSLLAWDQPLGSAFSPPTARMPGPGGPRFTLTASGDRIYARLGGQGRSNSVLVAVRNNRDVEGKRLWDRPSSDIPLPRDRPDAPNRFGANFEGSPVADARSVYVGLTDITGAEVRVFVAALDAETGDPRWVKNLGSGPTLENAGGMGMGGFNGMGMPNPAASEVGNRLLSLDGQTVYYQTNMGAVAALDSETGALRWMATYPVRERSEPTPAREANPAVVHGGLVFVAPSDALPIYAFDASTGRLVWKTPPMERISHLLGVAKGRLIATGDRVYSFDVKDGSLKATWPDGASGLEPCGRGLLAGDSIYWPTKTDIYVLDQSTGMKGDREPIRLMQHYGTGGGNLAVGDGYLVIAQKDALVVFCQSGRLIDRIRQEIARNPEPAAPYFQLARVAEATGQDELALKSLEDARAHAKPNDTIDGLPLAEEARAKQYKLLMRLAGRAESAKDWAAQARKLSEASRIARNDRDRLAARLLLASAQNRAGDPGAAVVTLQDILADSSLRSRTVPGDAEGRWTVRADLWVADQLDAILKAKGRELYAAYDAKAGALLAEGKAAKSARSLEEVARAYPAAKVAPESLLALGMLREEQKRPADAARAYKALAASPSASESLKARALLGLARAYESQDLILAARDALGRAQARYADLRLDDAQGRPAAVGSLVAERLASPPFARLGDRTGGGLAPPLGRAWEQSWPEPGRPLAAEGIPPSPASGRIFLADRSSIRPVDPITGALAWSFDLGEEPAWVGYLADRLLVAGPTRMVALDPARGEVRWRYPDGAPGAVRAAANPFAPPLGEPRVQDAPTGQLKGFRVVGSRVYCLRGDRELIALDGEAGAVEWSFAPAGGGINPNVLVGPSRVVLQIGTEAERGRTLAVLDTDTGRRRGEFPAAAGGDEPVEPWSRPPLAIDDDHVCVTLNPSTVALVDLTNGQRVWTSRVTTPALPRKGAPRFLGDASRLLVLYEGNELIRLDPATGRRLWNRSLRAEDLSESPGSFAMDADRLYCITGNPTGAELSAYDLISGDPLWSRPLLGPQAIWSVEVADGLLVAHPTTRGEVGDDRSFDGLALVVCGRSDGAPLQRFSFPAHVSDLAVAIAPRGAVLATQSGAWALAALPR